MPVSPGADQRVQQTVEHAPEDEGRPGQQRRQADDRDEVVEKPAIDRREQQREGEVRAAEGEARLPGVHASPIPAAMRSSRPVRWSWWNNWPACGWTCSRAPGRRSARAAIRGQGVDAILAAMVQVQIKVRWNPVPAEVALGTGSRAGPMRPTRAGRF